METDATRFLHTSDWHLGAPRSTWPWHHPNRAAWVDRLRDCREEAVRSVVALAIENRVDAVLVAGDVLDQPELEKDVKGRVERFVRSEVVEPLRLQGIRLVLTVGSHDWDRGKARRDGSLRLLRALEAEYPNDVAVLMPPGYDGSKCLEVGRLLIASEPPSTSRTEPWVELLHDQKDSRPGSPICRCYGGKHELSIYAKRHCYYPGSPFARTTAGPGGGAGCAGQRHALLLSVGATLAPDVQPIRLPVAETCVLTSCGSGWTLTYHSDRVKKQWQPATLLGEVQDVLQTLASDYPRLAWALFLSKDQPSRLPAPNALAGALRGEGRNAHKLLVWLPGR